MKEEEEEEEATAIIFLNQQSHEANGLHMCIFYGKLDVAIYAGRSKNTDTGRKKKQQKQSTTPTVHNKSIKKFKPACGLKQKRPLA
jgi:hypothetical protein